MSREGTIFGGAQNWLVRQLADATPSFSLFFFFIFQWHYKNMPDVFCLISIRFCDSSSILCEWDTLFLFCIDLSIELRVISHAVRCQNRFGFLVPLVLDSPDLKFSVSKPLNWVTHWPGTIRVSICVCLHKHTPQSQNIGSDQQFFIHLFFHIANLFKV